MTWRRKRRNTQNQQCVVEILTESSKRTEWNKILFLFTERWEINSKWKFLFRSFTHYHINRMHRIRWKKKRYASIWQRRSIKKHMVCSLFRKQIISEILSLWSFLRLIFNTDVYRDDRRDDVFASIITFEKGTSDDERFITIKNSRESHKWATLHETT